MIDHPRMYTVPIASDDVTVRVYHFAVTVHVMMFEFTDVGTCIFVVVAFTVTMPIAIFPVTVVIPPFVNDTPNPLTLHGCRRWFGPIDWMPSFDIRSAWMVMDVQFFFVRSTRFGMSCMVSCPLCTGGGGCAENEKDAQEANVLHV